MCGVCGVWCVWCVCCVCVLCVCGVCGVCVVCGVCGVMCGTEDSGNGVSVQARVYVQLIGWQNTWEQAPGVPATPSPP